MTETERILRILAGHAEEYAYFLDRYAEATHRLVAGIVDCAEDAEEVTQDAFIRAYEKLGSFRGDCRFSTWLYRIAYRLALRRAQTQRPEQPFDDEPQWERISDDVALPLLNDDEATDEQVEQLRQALDQLHPDERTLLMLTYEEERPAAETANIMGLSEANVRTRLCRLRKKLFMLLSHDSTRT